MLRHAARRIAPPRSWLGRFVGRLTGVPCEVRVPARGGNSVKPASRYLRGRPPTRSQTWRTFFANHFGERTFLSPLMVWNARSDDVIVDNYDVSSRPRHCPSMGRAPPFTGRVSTGVVRSNSRLLSCVAPRITFKNVQAREVAPAGTRRGIYSCTGRHGGDSFVRVCSTSATEAD